MSGIETAIIAQAIFDRNELYARAYLQQAAANAPEPSPQPREPYHAPTQPQLVQTASWWRSVAALAKLRA